MGLGGVRGLLLQTACGWGEGDLWIGQKLSDPCCSASLSSGKCSQTCLPGCPGLGPASTCPSNTPGLPPGPLSVLGDVWVCSFYSTVHSKTQHPWSRGSQRKHRAQAPLPSLSQWIPSFWGFVLTSREHLHLINATKLVAPSLKNLIPPSHHSKMKSTGHLTYCQNF